MSIVGMPLVGRSRPPGSPEIAGTVACIVGGTRDGTTGAAPIIGAVEAVRPVLLTGMPTEPVILQIKEADAV